MVLEYGKAVIVTALRVELEQVTLTEPLEPDKYREPGEDRCARDQEIVVHTRGAELCRYPLRESIDLERIDVPFREATKFSVLCSCGEVVPAVVDYPYGMHLVAYSDQGLLGKYEEGVALVARANESVLGTGPFLYSFTIPMPQDPVSETLSSLSDTSLEHELS
jgi:hypothetical protein